MAIKEETGGTSKNTKKPVYKPPTKPASAPDKKPTTSNMRGNVGHIKTMAVKNAVNSFMRYYGDSGIEARDRVRGILGDDFRSLSAKSQRDWPDIIQGGPVNSGYGDDYGGGGRGGGGGGRSTPLPPPPFKIRTVAGQRLTPYWESDPSFVQGWVPSLTVLGNTSAW